MSLRRYGDTRYADFEYADADAALVTAVIGETLGSIEARASEEGSTLDWSSLELSVEHEETENQTFGSASAEIARFQVICASVLGVRK